MTGGEATGPVLVQDEKPAILPNAMLHGTAFCGFSDRRQLFRAACLKDVKSSMWTALKARSARKAGRALLAVALALPWSAVGYAAPAAQTDIIGNGLTIDRDRADRIVPDVRPEVRKQPAQPGAPVTVAAPAAAASDMRLTKVRYDGASLSSALLDVAIADYIGKPLSRETLQAVANAVVAVYARSDIAFYSVTIPAQRPTGGMLTVKVVEGRIRDYTLSRESRSIPKGLVRAHMERLMRETPLRKSVLQRSLSLLRDVPGQTVNVKVRQLGQPGDLALDLEVKRKQLQIGVTVDNSGINNVTRSVQTQLSVAVNGVVREGDRLQLSGYLPFEPDRYQYYSASYSTPIGSNGMTLGFNLAHMKTRSDLDIEGDAKLAGVTLSYPVIRSYETNLTISASLDGVDSSNYYLDTRFGDYRSRAVRVGGAFSHVKAKSGYAVSLVASQGVDILGAKAFTGFSEKQFSKLNSQATAVVSVTQHVSVKTTLKAQYSRDKLPVTERFSLGGRGGGLAFPVGVATAEKAVAGSGELNWKLPAKSPFLKNCSLFVYGDGSSGRSVARPYYGLPAQTVTVASAGGGARIALARGWRASAEIAVPVKRPWSTYDNKARFLFGISRAV